MSFHPVQRYYPHSNPDHAGNPLIEVFPELSRDLLSRMMSSIPNFSAEERKHHASQRIQYLLRLSRFYIPFETQVDQAWAVWNIFLEGLRVRDPRKKVERMANFYALCDQILTGNVFADNGDLSTSDLACCSIGLPGTGKSLTLRRIFERFPQGFHHPEHQRLYQVISVWVDCPDTQGYAGLLLEIIRKLTDICEEHMLPFEKPTNNTIGVLQAHVATLCTILNLGMLFIDEIQHLAIGEKKVNNRTMIFLTGLVNRLRIPVVFVGTWKALKVLGEELRLMRRNVGIGSTLNFRMKNDAEWLEFLKGLFDYQWVQQPVELSEDIAIAFYDESQGIADLAIKLMQLVQMEAIRTGSEKITVDLVHSTAARHFTIIAPVLKQLKNGRTESDPSFEDLGYDSLEDTFKKYLLSMDISNGRGAKAGDSTLDKTTKQLKVAQVTGALMEVGAKDRSLAEELATKAVDQSPRKSAADIVASVVKDSKPKGPKVTKSSSKSKQAIEERLFEALGETDFRRIGYFAKKNKIAVHDAIAAAGFMFDPSTVLGG